MFVQMFVVPQPRKQLMLLWIPTKRLMFFQARQDRFIARGGSEKKICGSWMGFKVKQNAYDRSILFTSAAVRILQSRNQAMAKPGFARRWKTIIGHSYCRWYLVICKVSGRDLTYGGQMGVIIQGSWTETQCFQHEGVDNANTATDNNYAAASNSRASSLDAMCLLKGLAQAMAHACSLEHGNLIAKLLWFCRAVGWLSGEEVEKQKIHIDAHELEIAQPTYKRRILKEILAFMHRFHKPCWTCCETTVRARFAGIQQANSVYVVTLHCWKRLP